MEKKRWDKICDFIEKEKVPFLECTDGVYRPNFEEVAKRKGISQEKFENAYMEAYEAYLGWLRDKAKR
jgi:hypothetical protein